MFYNIPVKTYLHKSLNVSKGVVRSKELSLCTIEEIKREIKKQGATGVKRVSIKKGGKMETNTYIMAFNTPKIPEKIKVGYTMERVGQYVPNPLRCYKCQKYGYYEDNCRGRKYEGNVVNKILITTLMNVNFQINVLTDGDHPVYARSCDSWKLQNEIMAIKHRSNIPYHKALKIVTESKTLAYSHAVQ